MVHPPVYTMPTTIHHPLKSSVVAIAGMYLLWGCVSLSLWSLHDERSLATVVLGAPLSLALLWKSETLALIGALANGVVYAIAFGLIWSRFERRADARDGRPSPTIRTLALLAKSASLFAVFLGMLIPTSLICSLLIYPPPVQGGDFGGAGFVAIMLMSWSLLIGGGCAAIGFLVAILAFPKFRWVGCAILLMAAVAFGIWLYTR